MRELLIVTLSVGVALASMRAGGVLAGATLSIVATAVLAIAISAFVGRDELKCFAIGFLIPLCAYAGLHIVSGGPELDPYDGRLPTSRMLQPMYELVVRRRWVDALTGQELPDYQPAAVPARHQGGFLPAGTSPVTRAESPHRTTFMILGHVMMAMALGYAGGKFAIFVRRYQDHADTQDRPAMPSEPRGHK